MGTAIHYFPAPVRGLLLFIVYVALLWGIGWYNFYICGGTYNTIVSDTLLSAAFAVSFFAPLFPGCRKKATALLSLALLAAATITFVALIP